MKPRIYADFLKQDDSGRAILTCRGTLRDVEEQKVVLRDGLDVLLYSDDTDEADKPDDLEVDAKIEYDFVNQRWTAVYVSPFRHASDRKS